MIRHYMLLQDDCLRTCIACLIEAETVEEVPHFHDNPDEDDRAVTARVNDFLKTYGLAKWGYGYPGNIPLDAILSNVALNNPDTNYLLFGQQMDGTPHVVICRNAAIYHNPAPWGGEVVKPHYDVWTVVILIPEILRYE